MKITRKPVRVIMGHDVGNLCPTEIYAHEIAIQKLIRGEDKVQYVEDLDPDKYNMAPYEVESRDELIRLKHKYQALRDGDGMNPVDAIFPDGSRDLENFYAKGSKPKEVVTKDPEPPKEPDAPEKLKVKTRQEIVTELTALDIPFTKTQPTQQLAAKLAEAKSGTPEDE